MKDVNPSFNVAINAKVQRPQFVIKIYMGLDKTDPIYFTSHANTPVPAGVTVYRNVLRSVSGKSQKLNVLKANAEIGTLKFELLDRKGTITDLLNAKFFDVTLEKAMRHREVELYVGYGYDNADYELIFTQRVAGNLGYDGGKYSVTCYDIQREQRKKLFQMKETRLTSSIKADVTGVDISFNATGNQINSTTTNLSGYTVGEFIRITGSAGNSEVSPGVPKFFEVATSTANQITTVETIITEAAGQTIVISPATVNVTDTSEFLAVDHGASYTDGTAGKKVGYFKIDDETFSWEHGNTTATRFDKVSRAALGSRPAFHEVDSGITDEDRLPKVAEIMHLEMPSLKIAYALQTGVLYNQAGETLPDHWHAGIPTNLVNATEYLQYADEGLWDSTDDTKGQILRFIETKEIECKKYIEERIMRAAGCFNIVRSTGALGLIKSTGVIHDAATVATLDKSNVSRVSNLRYDQKDVYNLFRLLWNYIDGEPTREPIVFDNPSQVKYDQSQSMTIPLYGMYGGRHTKNHIANIFDTLRDRYAGSPLKATVECFTSLGVLEVGDIVQLKIDHIPDHTSVGKTLNRAVEVQRINVDFTKGVTLDVFGSTERSQSILQYTDGTAAGSTFITSQGTNMQTYLESTYGVDVVTDVSVPGVLKIKADCTIPGNASMASGIYYYDGAMQINSGVTVTVRHNWQWRFTDLFTNNGTIDGSGNGISGTSGTIANLLAIEPTLDVDYAGRPIWKMPSGYIGNSYGYNENLTIFAGGREGSRATNKGTHSVVDLNLEFDGVSLIGIPDDMRPCAGSPGPIFLNSPSKMTGDTGTGGNGGSSGVIISDGATGNFGSSIDLSGTEGNSVIYTHEGTSYQTVAHPGPGYGGCLSIIKLTPTSYVTGIKESFKSINGGFIYEQDGTHGLRTPMRRSDHSDSLYVEKFFPTYQVPSTDLPPQADKPASIVLTENVNTPQTVAGNLATITVDVTPPTTDGYSYSNIYYRIQGNSAWTFSGPADNQWVIQNLTMTGITYEVAAFPVSTTDVESTEFIMDTITMSNAAGGATLATGNYIRTGTATDFLVGDGSYTGDQKQFVGSSTLRKYVAFNGSDFAVGENTEILGVDAFNNESITRHIYINSNEITTVQTLSGVVDHQPSYTALKALASGDVASISHDMSLFGGLSTGGEFTWFKGRQLKTRLLFQSKGPNYDVDFFTGSISSIVGAKGIGIYISPSGVLSGYTANEGVKTLTTTTVSLSDGDYVDVNIKLSVDYDAPVYTGYVDITIAVSPTGYDPWTTTNLDQLVFVPSTYSYEDVSFSLNVYGLGVGGGPTDRVLIRDCWFRQEAYATPFGTIWQ